MAESGDTTVYIPRSTASGGTLPPAPPGPAPPGTAFATLAAHIRQGEFRTVELVPGSRVHHYEITGVIGRGGMSRVFDARHVYLGQEVALKTTLERPEDGDREFAERFLREAKALASLGHPNVVRVFDANVWEGIPYVITERLRGRNLAAELRAVGSLSVDRTLDILEDVTAVLERQEELRIVHRDIKPENLYLRADGTTCVFDYGLVGFAASDAARADAQHDDATRVGAIIGTPTYMAPEQISGRPVGPWTDIYCLGMTAWQSLTGKPPRSGASYLEVLQQALQPPPAIRSVRPDVPEGVERLVSTMLAPDREQRYASASELRRDLSDLRYRGRRVQGVIRGRAFVAMPFHRAFHPVWSAIENACIDASLRPTRVDRIVYVENIWSQIVYEIANSSVLIADFSMGLFTRTPNVNVVTEAAHAVAIGKPVIIISQSAPESLPFDWRHVPVVRYSRSRSGLADLRKDLSERLTEIAQGARPH